MMNIDLQPDESIRVMNDIMLAGFRGSYLPTINFGDAVNDIVLKLTGGLIDLSEGLKGLDRSNIVKFYNNSILDKDMIFTILRKMIYSKKEQVYCSRILDWGQNDVVNNADVYYQIEIRFDPKKRTAILVELYKVMKIIKSVSKYETINDNDIIENNRSVKCIFKTKFEFTKYNDDKSFEYTLYDIPIKSYINEIEFEDEALIFLYNIISNVIQEDEEDSDELLAEDGKYNAY